MSVKVYRCPSKISKNNSRSYAVSSMMNGLTDYQTSSSELGRRRSLIVKKITGVKRPSERLAMICQGGVPSTNYGTECYGPSVDRRAWIDVPPAVHMGRTGTSLSFADGHAEYWKWKRAKDFADPHFNGQTDAIADDDEDFDKIQRAVWGKVVRR